MRLRRRSWNRGEPRWLEQSPRTADVAITAPSAIHNLFLPVCVAPNVYLSTGCQAPVSGVIYK